MKRVLWSSVNRFGLLFCLQFLVASVGFTQHETNGGNYIALEFATKARIVLDYIQELPEYENPFSEILDLEKFEEAIYVTAIETSKNTLYHTGGGKADAIVVDNPKKPGMKKIILYHPFWDDAIVKDVNVYRLIFHEYLRVLDVPDENGLVSSKLDVSQFGRIGELGIADLINLDFEEPINFYSRLFGWYLGQFNGFYHFETDRYEKYQGESSLKIESKQLGYSQCNQIGQCTYPMGYATQCMDAEPYLGKTLLFTGFIKTSRMFNNGGAGLWVRIDGHYFNQLVYLDNMFNRMLNWNTDWKRVDLAFNVDPKLSKRICFGGILAGQGVMWIDGLKMRVLK